MRALQTLCYIIHRRPYRETSLLIDVIAASYGRMTLVLKGAQPAAKVAKSGVNSANAQPLQPLLLTFSGAGELKTAHTIEVNGPPLALHHKFLYCAFYINELLVRLWPQNIQSDQLYSRYHQLLLALAAVQQTLTESADQQQGQVLLEQLLRQFEFELLHMLGYGINWYSCYDSQLPITAEGRYQFMADQGFSATDRVMNMQHSHKVFAGADILAIGTRQALRGRALLAAKQISRLAFEPHLGNKPLKSRELFTM